MKIIHIVGARPNFMKVAPVMESFDNYFSSGKHTGNFRQLLVHTGQHYDREMSALFFEELGIPEPDINLQVGSGPHGQQTGRIMEAFEKVLIEEMPDLVLVVGDVNSTLACAIDAKKLNIPVAHVEAGLRSRDMSMPEEINRIVTDSIADLLFTTDRLADENLKKEGVPDGKIHFVGNVMIDTLLKHKEKALKLPTLETYGLLDSGGVAKPYTVVTIHRPGNVEIPEILSGIGEALAELGSKMPVLFPVHPRTRERFKKFKLERLFTDENGIQLLEPLGYLDFLNLMANSSLILTDSGGIQEESTILSIPCLTVRPNTERPITIEQGTNRLVDSDRNQIIQAINNILENPKRTSKTPDLWDGKASQRIVKIIVDWFNS